MAVKIVNPLTIVKQGSTPVPSEDLELPTPAENEAYFLLDIQPDSINDVHFAVDGNGISGTATACAFGTSSGGQFIQDTTISEMNSTSGWSINIAASKFVTTTGGRKQLIAKAYGTSITGFGTFNSCANLIRKIKGNAPNCVSAPNPHNNNEYRTMTSLIEYEFRAYIFNSSLCSGAYNLRKAKLIGRLPESTGLNNFFVGCTSLQEIDLDGLTFGTEKTANSTFSGCRSLRKLPAFIKTLSGLTSCPSLFSGCWGLSYYDLRGFDFSSVGASMNGFAAPSPYFPTTIRFGDTFGLNGLEATSAIVSLANTNVGQPCYVTIEKTDAMLSIATAATTLFSASNLVTVYVPDSLLVTYQADTNWVTLGTRLKALSEYPGTLPA